MKFTVMKMCQYLKLMDIKIKFIVKIYAIFQNYF